MQVREVITKIKNILTVYYIKFNFLKSKPFLKGIIWTYPNQ